MPVVSTLGAMSSRGFGEFSQAATANYIEDYFSTYLYTGTGKYQTVINNISLADTAAWSTVKLIDVSVGGGTANSVTTDSSGNYYMVGRAYNARNYILVVKFNSLGVVQWKKNLDDNDANGTSVAVDSSGNVYVGGYTSPGGVYRAFVAKYNSSGTLQWKRQYSEGNSAAYGVAVDSSGNVYAVGYTSAGGPYFFVSKYNSSGTLQWQRYLKQGNSYGYGISVDSSGNCFVTGSATSTNDYLLLAKYDTSGTLQWKRILRQSTSQSVGFGTAVDSAGNVIVTGYASNGTSTGIIIAKYNTSGTIQWKKRLAPDTGFAYGQAISIDSSDNIYVSGYTNDAVSDVGFLVKYNSSGTLQWQRRFNQNTTNSVGCSVDTSGNVYASGSATDTSGYAYIIKLKSDGTTTSGTALLNLAPWYATDSTSGATDAASSAVDSAGTGTDAASSATETTSSATASSATQAATQSSNGLVWLKSRNQAYNNYLANTLQGANNVLWTNSTSAVMSYPNAIVNFLANGFAIGTENEVNSTNNIFSSWTFKKQSKFFDIVTYTGTGSNLTVNHNLGSVPGMIIIKRTDGISNWIVYHRSVGATGGLQLNNTSAVDTNSGLFNNTSPTSSVFTVGTDNQVNVSSATYVAYLFAHDAGGFGLDGSQNVISCGSFTTDSGGNATVSLGYEPQFILYKPSSSVGAWRLGDNMRGIVVTDKDSVLNPNSTAIESVNTAFGNPTATGFDVEGAQGNATYIYITIRRGPMKVPTDATTVFMPTVYTGTNVNNRLVDTTIAPDMVWIRQRNSTTVGGMVVGDRLRGQPYLLTGTTAAEVNDADSFDAQIVSTTEYGNAFSSMSGVWVGNDATSQLNASTTASNQIAEAFKRAPGFFDIACYTGNGASTQTINHNLGVVPEMMIVKRRNTAGTSWGVYSASYGPSQWILLNSSNVRATQDNGVWGGVSPTKTQFTVGNYSDVNASGSTYVCYLFASCPGVSKVGTYTGTSSTLTINCGFTNGSRFVLIKPWDISGGWYVYDSARGISPSDDPFILLNSTDAEVTNTNYIANTESESGFVVNNSTQLNSNTFKYIYLAIA